MRPLAAPWLVLLVACGGGEAGGASPSPGRSSRPATDPPASPAPRPAPPPPPTAPAVRSASSPPPPTADPLDRLPDEGDRQVDVSPSPGGAAPRGIGPAAGTCVLASPPVRVWPSAAPPAVAADGEVALVAGYGVDAGTDVAFVVEWSGAGPPRPLRRIRLAGSAPADRRSAPPGLLVLPGGRALVALAQDDGRLVVREVRRGDASGADDLSATLGEGADLRFAPALAAIGDRVALAWTDGRSTPMHLRLVMLDAALRPVGPVRDLTPVSMGAAAPAFVAGAAEPLLLFVDPRRGISPIHRVGLGADGALGESRVIVSTGVAPERPVLAGVLAGPFPLVAWSVVGRAATTAVGLARLDERWTAYARPPEPLVPGTAYTPLSVSAVRLEGAAVLAADRPSSAGVSPPVQVEVRVVRPVGPLGAPLVVAGPDDTGRDAALAALGSRHVVLAFRDGGGTHAARLDCAP